MSKYLDEINNGNALLRSAVEELRELSSAFSITGNDTLAGRLHSIACDVENARYGIDNAVTEEINRSANASEASARATVEAALLGLLGGKA